MTPTKDSGMARETRTITRTYNDFATLRDTRTEDGTTCKMETHLFIFGYKVKVTHDEIVRLHALLGCYLNK